MIFVKANRLQPNAGHTPEQLWQDLANITADASIQDPAAVFTNPNYVVLKKVTDIGPYTKAVVLP